MPGIYHLLRKAVLAVVILMLTACGGSGGGSNNNPVVDVPPSANAGADQSVAENSLVTLRATFSGSATPLAAAWSQVSGIAVVLSAGSGGVASFDAPDVAATETLVFRVTVTDATGRMVTDDVAVAVSDAPPFVAVSGTLEYEDPAHNASCDGINFNSIQNRPIRGATVQLIDATTQGVLQSTVSSDIGEYTFPNVASQDSVFVRVRAELKRSGMPSWDMEVRDNTSNTGVPLSSRPIYVLDGPARAPGSADDQRDMLARTGWTGSGFGNPRAAAPFSILDTLYAAVQLVLTADANALFPPMDAYWSVNNSTAVGSIDVGDIGTSFYRGDLNGLFLLGLEGDDIEEFDTHVIAHEWGHYFEDNFSRADSIGGPHGSNDRLDPRVAFGEGFATALSGMILDSDTYCDAFWSAGNLRGFRINLEGQNTGARAGWFNEASVMKMLYDLWDSDIDGADTSSIPFATIFAVLGGPQATTTAFTTIFSFAEGIRNAGTGQNPFIDAVLDNEDVVAAGIDRWGSTETNDQGSANSLPVYTTVMPNGIPVNVCSSNEFDPVGATANKLNVHRFLRLDLASASRYTFNIQADAATLALLPPDDPGDDRDQSDPDMYYYRSGVVQNRQIGNDEEGTSGIANSESFTSVNVLAPGTYVIDFIDWRFEDELTDPGYPTTTCFDISVTPSP